MNTATETMANGIEMATRITLRMTEDLQPAEWLHRPCDGGNCAAWIVGHLVMSGRSMLMRAGVPADMPPLPDGFDKRFARDETAPKSQEYGDISNLRSIFEQQHMAFAAAVRSMDPSRLDVVFDANHPLFKTVGQMFTFAPVHIGTHAGQISTIRRTLGRKPLI